MVCIRIVGWCRCIQRQTLSLWFMRVLKAVVEVIVLLMASLLGEACYDFFIIIVIIIVNQCLKILFLKLDRRSKDYLLTDRGCSMIFLSACGDVRGKKTGSRFLLFYCIKCVACIKSTWCVAVNTFCTAWLWIHFFKLFLVTECTKEKSKQNMLDKMVILQASLREMLNSDYSNCPFSWLYSVPKQVSQSYLDHHSLPNCCKLTPDLSPILCCDLTALRSGIKSNPIITAVSVWDILLCVFYKR